jgi:uncharacterized protein (TIGR04255 family)
MNYSTNYLSQVVFQANHQITSLKDSIDSDLKQLCIDKSGANVTELKNTEININGQQVNMNVSTRWVFTGKRFQIVITRDFIQIVNFNYTTHAEYHPIISDIYNKFRSVYKPIISRVALRYINHIKFNDGTTYDFKGLINQKLVDPTIEYKDFGLTRSIGVMNIYDKVEDIYTNFTYGFVNPEYPNEIVKRNFVLDYDCFINLNVIIEDIHPVLLKLREKVNTLFEKSILPGLQEKMK